MKKIYWSARTLIAGGVASLMGWLGLSGCDGQGPINRGMMEYGTPTVRYQFKVRVSDQDGKPVEGIQLDLADEYDKEVLTDADGKATLEGQITSFGMKQVKIHLQDVDGEANGVVEEATYTQDLSKNDYVDKGDGHWDNGTVAKDIDIAVERK